MVLLCRLPKGLQIYIRTSDAMTNGSQLGFVVKIYGFNPSVGKLSVDPPAVPLLGPGGEKNSVSRSRYVRLLELRPGKKGALERKR